MKNDNRERYILLSDVCKLLNRDPEQLDEFFDGQVEIVTIDDELCVSEQELLDFIADKIAEKVESE